MNGLLRDRRRGKDFIQNGFLYPFWTGSGGQIWVKAGFLDCLNLEVWGFEVFWGSCLEITQS